MIASHGRDGRQVPRGIQRHLRRAAGAVAARVIEAPNARIAEHHHDWPVLTLYVTGEVVLIREGHEQRVDRPALALHGAGEVHSSRVGSSGLEQVDIEFDPSWLGSVARLADWRHGRIWVGGTLAARADLLRRQWSDPRTAEADLARSTASVLEAAFGSAPVRVPHWLGGVLREVDQPDVCSTAVIARRLGLHPGWLAQAYRAAVGEGLGQTIRRKRVQRAVTLLRTTGQSPAEIAVDSGFCDQSHMIRSFKMVLGRRPSCIRTEGCEIEGLVGHPWTCS